MLNGPTDTTSRPVTSGQSWPFAPLLVGSAEPVVGEERDGLGWTTWLPRSQLVRMSSPVAATAATTRRPLPDHDPVHVPTTGDDGGCGLAVHTRTARAERVIVDSMFLDESTSLCGSSHLLYKPRRQWKCSRGGRDALDLRPTCLTLCGRRTRRRFATGVGRRQRSRRSGPTLRRAGSPVRRASIGRTEPDTSGCGRAACQRAS
jgi:hypothetical protein